jgi:hypothetical protein
VIDFKKPHTISGEFAKRGLTEAGHKKIEAEAGSENFTSSIEILEKL